MGKEIERKFLVVGNAWRELAEGELFRQGYISTVKERVIRVRTVGNKGTLTVKGITVHGSRLEYEYEIPLKDANEMLETSYCEQPIIEKRRYTIPYGGFIWEVDEFQGVNKGLIVAEIELADIDQEFPKPDWIGDDVTDDPRYFNSNLIAKPYAMW
jgi:CYTH domain-containing protein